MNQELNISELIIDYQNSTQQVVEIFKRKFNVDNILDGWHSKKYGQTGKILDEGITFYACHGIGIATHFTDKYVDFDFAYLPELRHDGFDLWKLISFAKSQPKKYGKYLDEELLKSKFESLKNGKIIHNPKIELLTHLYFWTKDLTNEQIKNNIIYRPKPIKSKWRFWKQTN